jgi:putative SOS response-associated peptidase YedK
MCGRITSTFEFGDLRVRWNLNGDFPMYSRRYNIAPEQISSSTENKVPVILRHGGENACRLMHWGLIPNWAKDPSVGNRMINARAESLREKPAFKQLVETRRCIVPADGFYEWRKEGKRKVPMWFHLRSSEPFAFAGLWDTWRKPNGNKLDTFTIITTEPNELMRPIHNRMPVILRREDEEQWLDVSRTSFAKSRSLLKPYPDELMYAHDVSQLVNSAKYDGPECIEPVLDDQLPGSQLSLI